MVQSFGGLQSTKMSTYMLTKKLKLNLYVRDGNIGLSYSS